MSTPSFPRRIIKLGDRDRATVTAIQQRLVERSCGPLEQTGVFDARTRAAVRLFQARFPDRSGAPLVVDGKVGLFTWESLFGEGSGPATPGTADALLARMLELAAGEIGVLEEPRGSNRGPRVDEYLRATGLNAADGSFPWCAAFVFWCSEQAATAMGRGTPVIRTAGVLSHWQKAGQAVSGGSSRLMRRRILRAFALGWSSSWTLAWEAATPDSWRASKAVGS